jgi:hypothetical protein
MDKNIKNLPAYISKNLDEHSRAVTNRVTAEGLRFLGKAHWS